VNHECSGTNLPDNPSGWTAERGFSEKAGRIYLSRFIFSSFYAILPPLAIALLCGFKGLVV
jgi:carbohydrate-binding DOMON domain-containing protein